MGEMAMARARVAAVAAAMLLIGIAGVATAPQAVARPTAVAVKVTIKAKSDPRPGCGGCLHLTGRVKSPKSACRAGRVLGSALRYRAGSEHGGRTYRDDYFVKAMGTGRWDILVAPFEPLAWFEVIVLKKRIGTWICRGARARLTL